MALKALDGSSVWRYSTNARRSLIAMVGRRTLQRMNGSASHTLFRPFVVMAARALGPGPTRLKLVKLAHNLSSRDLPAGPDLRAFSEEHAPAVQPTQRAA